MFDGGAPRQDRSPGAVRSMRVNDGAKPYFFRFAAGCIDLIDGHSHLATIPNARRGEQFDQIGSLRLQLIHQSSNLVGSPAVLVDLSEGCEQARTRYRTLSDHFTEIGVARGSDALHG